ncbi:hypothetical protein EDD16DRAFT_779680 [Pisolithus croceorrhizus]|nr:hypothetical protein EDD16DRAFT_779680 [Pisolithus croceorrhizus]KAI6135898.1 hypothetical protein EDD17DRAFT_522920 [Pisolithus thermaeus]
MMIMHIFTQSLRTSLCFLCCHCHFAFTANNCNFPLTCSRGWIAWYNSPLPLRLLHSRFMIPYIVSLWLQRNVYISCALTLYTSVASLIRYTSRHD